MAQGPVSQSSGNYGARYAVLISVKDGSFKRFENGGVKLLAKQTKWTSMEVRAHPTFLETLISKYDFRPVKLPGLSTNRSQVGLLLVLRFSSTSTSTLLPISGFSFFPHF